jgi:hypothetical protein
MKLLQSFAFAIVVALLASSAASAQTYNVVTDFSLASNPNGAWSYGFTFMPGTPFILYTTANSTCIPGMSFWALQIGPCSLIPEVGHNDTTGTVCFATDCVPPDYLVTTPGYNDQLSVTRWTAPAAGVYGIEGAAMGTDCVYPTTTDFHVSQNSHSLLTVTIDSCDIATSFNMRRTFAAGDTLDFTTDWGADGNVFGDGTGFRATITFVP